jgi:hypothetical protein
MTTSTYSTSRIGYYIFTVFGANPHVFDMLWEDLSSDPLCPSIERGEGRSVKPVPNWLAGQRGLLFLSHEFTQ